MMQWRILAFGPHGQECGYLLQIVLQIVLLLLLLLSVRKPFGGLQHHYLLQVLVAHQGYPRIEPLNL